MAFGINGLALEWVRSFLVQRTQQVNFGGRLSSIGYLVCGVPQDSVLVPLLFLLYTAELFDVVAECGLSAYTYADDTQVYLSVPAAEASNAGSRRSWAELRLGWAATG